MELQDVNNTNTNPDSLDEAFQDKVNPNFEELFEILGLTGREIIKSSDSFEDAIIKAKSNFANIFLTFIVEENQTAVGQIDDPLATSFTISKGLVNFNIANDGTITFKSAPNYELQNIYILWVTSNSGRIYIVTVNVTDVVSTFALNYATELNYATTF